MTDWAAQRQRTILRQKLVAAIFAAIVMTAVFGISAMRAGADVTPIAAEHINPNTATAADLMRLPGIGRARAMDIIKMRPYESAADLSRVRGIGQKTIEKIAPYLSFDSEKKETTDFADCTD